jgi:predicted amidohydrolase YtcJ
VVAVHEMSTPGTDTREGLAALLALTADPQSRLPLVVGYRGELCVTADDARELAAQIPGLTGIGGDLAVDGSFEDRTARLRTAYQDAPGELGLLELSAEQIANHVGAVTRAGLQAGFHVVGDAALDELLLGIRAAADVEGLASVAGAGHRLEHADMVDASALAALAVLGLRVSAQPAVGRARGGPQSLDVDRLGPSRSAGLQPFADLAQVGVPLAFGSDAPYGPLDPWQWVAAAFQHHQQGQRVSSRAAFRAATRAGWRLAGLDHTGAGELRVGAPAHLAVWRADDLVVEAVDGRFTSWSTDARAGTPLLPSVAPDAAPPVCLRTVRAGLTLFDRFG